MKIEYFRYLVTIERLGSISAASKHYGIKQNTLSTIVKQAEEEFGFTIFQRTPDGVVPTPLGTEFLYLAKDIDLSYSRIMSVQKQVTGKPSVNIVTDPVTGSVVTIPLTKSFYNSGSRGNLRFYEKSIQEAIVGFGSDVEKLAIMRLDMEMHDYLERHIEKDVQIHSLLWDEMCVVVSAEHPLAECESISPKQLKKCDVICNQAMEDEVHHLLGDMTESFESFNTCSCERHLLMAALEENHAAIVSRFSVFNDPIWADKSVKVLNLVDTPNENRQEIVLAYFNRDMERPRNEIVKNCILDLFEALKERSGL